MSALLFLRTGSQSPAPCFHCIRFIYCIHFDLHLHSCGFEEREKRRSAVAEMSVRPRISVLQQDACCIPRRASPGSKNAGYTQAAHVSPAASHFPDINILGYAASTPSCRLTLLRLGIGRISVKPFYPSALNERITFCVCRR